MKTLDTVDIPVLVCLRCGHKWHPRKREMPTRCASVKCRSPYWRKPRKSKKSEKSA